jgi:anthranilate synthase component 1
MRVIRYNNDVKSTVVYSKTEFFSNDIVTPMAAYLTLDRPNAFFLESVEKGHAMGRFSIIGLDPLIRLKGYEDRLEYTANGKVQIVKGNPLDTLSDISRAMDHRPTGGSPIKSGFFGYFSWDIIQSIEPVTVHAGNAPLFDFQMPKYLIVFDHARQLMYITQSSVEPLITNDGILAMKRTIMGPLPVGADDEVSHPPTLDWDQVSSNWSKSGYEAAVDTIKEHIKEGDIFQAVLSQRFWVPQKKSPLAVYRSLRQINPSPYMFYFNYGDTKIIGSSPEILVKSQDGAATLRPIAGTRLRVRGNESALIESLTSDEKEVSEHIMLVDLGRNDLGRVCDTDSIQISDLMSIEQYSHVIHMVTNVQGSLTPNTTPMDVFKATFPAGTVSGAPKIRAIEIINHLEPTPRGIYSGSVGYFNLDGACDFCISIRTIVASDGAYHVQAGAGIVNDSVPDSEYNETKNKAQGILLACFNGGKA